MFKHFLKHISYIDFVICINILPAAWLSTPFSTSSFTSSLTVTRQSCRCPQCACPLPPAPLVDAACRWTMLEEEVQLVQPHPRATVRSLNGKALNLTGVIWTVRFWSTSSTPAAPDPYYPNPKLPWTHIFSHYVSISFSVECRFMSVDAVVVHLSSLSQLA